MPRPSPTGAHLGLAHLERGRLWAEVRAEGAERLPARQAAVYWGTDQGVPPVRRAGPDAIMERV
ncbi:MAG: hypothetical protein ACLQVK_02180 [Acidimicrobiales bacterium]